MMLKKLALGSFLLISCTSTVFAANDVTAKQVATSQKVTFSGAPAANSSSPNYYADMWYRDSAERNAIYREVFLLAEQVIKQKVATQHLKPKEWGVVLDIDETVLDNTEWNYQHDILGKPESWQAFAEKSESIALPGVKKFIDDIHQMGGYVNLVSNRAAPLQAATEKNLQKQNIYYDQVLLYEGNIGSSFIDKNPRFNGILAGKAPSKLPAQKIVAWFGDNIQDLPGVYQKDMIKQNPNGPAYDKWGIDYFTLPNPIYGSWQKNEFK